MLNITCEATPAPRPSTREDKPKIVGRGKPATKQGFYSVKRSLPFFQYWNLNSFVSHYFKSYYYLFFLILYYIFLNDLGLYKNGYYHVFVSYINFVQNL